MFRNDGREQKGLCACTYLTLCMLGGALEWRRLHTGQGKLRLVQRRRGTDSARSNENWVAPGRHEFESRCEVGVTHCG